MYTNVPKIVIPLGTDRNTTHAVVDTRDVETLHQLAPDLKLHKNVYHSTIDGHTYDIRPVYDAVDIAKFHTFTNIEDAMMKQALLMSIAAAVKTKQYPNGLKWIPFRGLYNGNMVVSRKVDEVAKILLNPDAVGTELATVSSILHAIPSNEKEAKLAYAKRLLGNKQIQLPESVQPGLLQSPQFKAWFGDSKVVDKNGNPLKVYHGTGADFAEFQNSKTGRNDRGLWGRGHYFASSPEIASSYAHREGDGAKVLPVYASIKNPLILKTGKDLITRLPDGTNTRDLTGDLLDGVKIKDIAISGGHDGIIQFKPNGEIGDIVVFNPNQIKSAFNRGTFDPESPKISETANPTDTVELDVPLFIRMLEYAKEDAKSDIDLHKVTEKMIELSKQGKTMTMDDYETIIRAS